MVITLQDIFQDAVSNFPGSAQGFDAHKVFNFINQNYIKVRDQYLTNDEGDEFAISQNLTSFSASTFPYLNQATLNRPVLQRVALDTAIVSTIIRTAPELTEPTLIDKFFEPEDVRNYHPGNGLRYFKGDVVFEDGQAYRAKSTLIATSTDPLVQQTSDWEPVYFMQEDVGYSNAEIINYKNTDRQKVTIDTGRSVITANKTTIFVSKDIKELDIEYVPEHTDITDWAGTFVLPDGARKAIRDMVVADMMSILPNTKSEEDGER